LVSGSIVPPEVDHQERYPPVEEWAQDRGLYGHRTGMDDRGDRGTASHMPGLWLGLDVQAQLVSPDAPGSPNSRRPYDAGAPYLSLAITPREAIWTPGRRPAGGQASEQTGHLAIRHDGAAADDARGFSSFVRACSAGSRPGRLGLEQGSEVWNNHGRSGDQEGCGSTPGPVSTRHCGVV